MHANEVKPTENASIAKRYLSFYASYIIKEMLFPTSSLKVYVIFIAKQHTRKTQSAPFTLKGNRKSAGTNHSGYATTTSV